MRINGLLLLALARASSEHPLLQIPADFGAMAAPIWSTNKATHFIMARKEFTAPGFAHAVAFVTAQQSPFCAPDPRLVGNDYGACLPHGGTSQPKLLGAYKLLLNGQVIGMGPGRRVNQTQGVDAIDVTSLVAAGKPNVLGLQGYHSPSLGLGGDGPRMQLALVLTGPGGAVSLTVPTDASWRVLAADAVFNPNGGTGAWAGNGKSSHMPHESIDMRVYPTGWASPGYQAGAGWQAPAIGKPFVLPLGPKSRTGLVRPLAVFARNAASVTALAPGPPPSPPGPPAPCGIVSEGHTAHIGCITAGDAVSAVAFASFGTVTGTCNAKPGTDSFKKGSCDANSSVAVVAAACLGKHSCEINVGVNTFGEPCHRIAKSLAWDVVCSAASTGLPRSPRFPRSPCSATSSATYLIDYGLEMQGGVNITFKNGVAGQQVTIKLSEELLPDGSVKMPMRTGNDFVDTWILRDGEQTVMQHEYMEFRYAQVEGSPDVLTAATALAWVVRYPLTDDLDDQYGDTPMIPQTAVSSRFPSPAGVRIDGPLRPPAALAKFESGNASLQAVWGLVRHTLVAVSLDINTDSNTRQRDLCHTDAFIAGIGQMAISSDYGVSQMTAEDGFQLDSNIWQGTTDFRAALVSLATEQALYSGDLALVRQRYDDMKKHTLDYFFDPSLGLVSKPAGTMGAAVNCPASWSPAGMPPGIYEALHCTASDLIDWPSGSRDGYISTNNTVSAVANAYIALATGRMAEVAGWLGEHDDRDHFHNVSVTILRNLRLRLYNATAGEFVDGLGITHASMHATLFPTMAGAVDEIAVPGMGLAVVNTLKAKGMRCSCMAGFWLLEGLYKVGWHTAEAADHALDVLTSTGTNSWINMIKQGATATMEAWTVEEKENSSWSHPWCAGPNSVIIRRLLGLVPMLPGWARAQFSPQPSSLINVSATIPTGVGTVNIVISQSGASFSATLTTPIAATRVCIPPAHGVAATAASTVLRVNGTAVQSIAEGRMLCTVADVGPGSHLVERKL